MDVKDISRLIRLTLKQTQVGCVNNRNIDDGIKYFQYIINLTKVEKLPGIIAKFLKKGYESVDWNYMLHTFFLKKTCNIGITDLS